MDLTNVFVTISIAIYFFGIVALFLMLPNPVQKRFTQQDRTGWGIMLIGLVFGVFAYAFANGALPHTIGIYDLSTALAMLVAPISGACLGLGLTIGLPDRFTDKVLNQKNLPILGVILVIVVVALAFILG